MQDYTKRLILPLEQKVKTSFFTEKSRELVATRYTRVVIGSRGPYIEFNTDSINMSNFHVPPDQLWRFTSSTAYYIEYRSIKDNVKLYIQLRTVNYADYKVGMCYISPFDLISDIYPVLITKL